jgi:hypothetical protein
VGVGGKIKSDGLNFVEDSCADELFNRPKSIN